MLGKMLPPQNSTQSVQWVPDEEVNECPMCGRRFNNISLRKHHCRACGKVVCGNCSNNLMVLPGGRTRERVCDDCHTFHLHGQAASLTENMSKNREVQAVLKANLNEKHRQVEGYKEFLRDVAGVAAMGDGGGTISGCNEEDFNSPSPSPTSSVRGPPLDSSSTGGDPGDSPACSEMRTLEGHARRRWTQVCTDLWQNSAEIDRLRHENKETEGKYAAKYGEVQRLEKHVQSLEADLRDCPIVISERDQLGQKNLLLQRELEGLTRRMQALQADRPTSSFSSSFSSLASSDVPDAIRRHCRDRARNACALM